MPVLSEKEENVRAVNEAKSRYDRYRDQIILPNRQFNKQVFGDSLKNKLVSKSIRGNPNTDCYLPR